LKRNSTRNDIVTIMTQTYVNVMKVVLTGNLGGTIMQTYQGLLSLAPLNLDTLPRQSDRSTA
jgi:hypothetical protein